MSAESGAVSVFEESGRDLRQIGQLYMPHAHTVSVDPKSHLVYFPLENVDGHPTVEDNAAGSLKRIAASGSPRMKGEQRLTLGAVAAQEGRSSVPGTRRDLTSHIVYFLTGAAIESAVPVGRGVSRTRAQARGAVPKKGENGLPKRLAGAGFKPPRAASFKRCGSEQLGKRPPMRKSYIFHVRTKHARHSRGILFSLPAHRGAARQD